MWQWLTVIGLAATPAVFLGQTAAWGAAFGFDLPTWPAGIAIVIAGYAEALLLLYLAALADRIPRLHRWLSKLRVPRFDPLLTKWGTWTALLLGTAIAGQEPVIIALVWLGVKPRKLILPLLVENVLYTALYYFVMKLGWTAITGC
jgi:hypothetical protein